MERLSDNAITILHTGMFDYQGEYIPLIDAANRLAAYEDTGLEPEDVTDLMAAHGTAIGQLTEYRALGTIGHLRELVQAEKDNRPKVGDTVWANISIKGDQYKKSDRPYPVKVVFVGVGEESAWFHVQYENGRIFPFDFKQIGETVFLTREEAEAALKGGTK